MGRPSWRERTCLLELKSEDGKRTSTCYGISEKLYVRRNNKMIPVGRMCATCGNIVLGYDTSK